MLCITAYVSMCIYKGVYVCMYGVHVSCEIPEFPNEINKVSIYLIVQSKTFNTVSEFELAHTVI